jgi:phenylpropionate dioxygenase-like ring-hydroxylating dioxygenase large terminal subunit
MNPGQLAEAAQAETKPQIAVSPIREREAWSKIEEQFASGLRGYWYAITTSAEVPQGGILSIKRMGEDLAVWRDRRGAVHVMVDRCPHRGAKLTRGRVEEDGLRCIYHGWLYNGAGECIDIPSEGSACSFLRDVRAKSYPAEEHGGLVFAYFSADAAGPAEPFQPPYELESPEWSGFIVRHHWKGIRWFRALENLLDPFHAPFLHAGTYTLSKTKSYQDTIVVDKNADGSLSVHRKGQNLVNFDSTEFHFPNWTRLDIPYPWTAGPGGPMRIVVTVCPIDDESSQVYMVRKRKITSWKWWIWRALWYVRLKRKMWDVLDQDEDILLSQTNGQALRSEYLVQSDMGIVRMRNMFREAYRKQRENAA